MSNQQYTIEYEVPVAVDGSTAAPAFSVDPASPDFKQADADGIYRFTAAQMQQLTGGRLGLIDPDFGVGGTFADRFIHMIEVRTSGAGAAAQISVVDARDPDLAGQEEILAPSPEADFYTDDCVFVPQGSDLAFAGFTPAAGSPVVIRVNVVAWGSVEDYAELLEACCCLGDGDGDGDGDCCPPSVLQPTTPLDQAAAETLTLSAGTCGLDEPLTGEVFNDPESPPPTGLPTINSISVNTGTPPVPNTVDVSLDTTGTSGDYILVLTNACECCTPVRFTVFPA